MSKGEVDDCNTPSKRVRDGEVADDVEETSAKRPRTTPGGGDGPGVSTPESDHTDPVGSPNGHSECPYFKHCPRCIDSYILGNLKSAEKRHGCCQSDVCWTETPEWERDVLDQIAGDTQREWRYSGYRLAFRFIHDYGQRGVRVPHSTCVLYSVRAHVKAEGPRPAEED
jgi:hypothetical protein